MFFFCHNIAAYLVVNERLFSGGQRGEVEMLEKPARENVTIRNCANVRQKKLRKHFLIHQKQETNCNIL